MGSSAPFTPDALGPVRFLIPWRPDHGHRDKVWAHCSAHWARVCPDVPQHTAAGPPGTFNRAAAVNAAAVGAWDVAVILDADVVAPAEQVYAAVRRARAVGRLVLGFEHYAALGARSTLEVLAGAPIDTTQGVRYRSDQHESSIVAVPRALWDRLGGMDTRFQGWGQEDVAFAHAARLLGGGVERIAGTVVHLFHERSPYRDRRLESHRAAQRLGARYRACTTPQEVQALLAEPPEEGQVEQPDVSSIARVSAFSRIYRGNAWRGRETRSGPGSGTEATAALTTWLPQVCEELGIASVLDAGCGEGMWQPELPGYIGVDLVREAIAVAQRHHPERSYGLADICRDQLPTTDAVLCRDALQHLPLGDAQAAITNFRRAGAKYLLASSHIGEANVEVAPGAWYPCNLEAAPFWFPAPLRATYDGHWEGQERYPAKILGVWAL